jgi:Kae1-associated kinase Bud32
MKERIIKIGAEAIISETTINGKKCIKKNRIKKDYRAKELDEKIRAQRMKREANILRKAARIKLRVPEIYFEDKKNKILYLELIKGKLLKEWLNNKNKKVLIDLGKTIGLLHKNNIIHGDLTTSNVIKENKKLALIDFGLAFESQKIEDKAIDLLNLKRTFNATHSNIKNGFNLIIKGYKKEEPNYLKVIKQLNEAEKRARYK